MYYPPSGFYFSLNFEGFGSSDASFAEASGLTVELAYEEINEGGENHFNYRVPSRVKYPHLVLKRGLVIKKSPVAEWCVNSMQKSLASSIKTRTVTLKLLDPKKSGSSLAAWVFYNAYPVKWDITGFNAQASEFAVENLELAYSYFEYVPENKMRGGAVPKPPDQTKARRNQMKAIRQAEIRNNRKWANNAKKQALKNAMALHKKTTKRMGELKKLLGPGPASKLALTSAAKKALIASGSGTSKDDIKNKINELRAKYMAEMKMMNMMKKKVEKRIKKLGGKAPALATASAAASKVAGLAGKIFGLKKP
ncbi:MAG: phage tail protein [Bacteroidota bacterium]